MKVFNITFALVLVLSITTTIQAQIALPDALQGNPLEDKMIGDTPDSPFGPIHFFPLDGSVVDQLTGVAALTTDGISSTEGYFDAAIYFDGTAFVQIPLDLDIEPMPNMTIVAMVKPDPLPDDPDARLEFYNTGYVISDSEGLVYLGNHNKDIPYFSALSNRASISNSIHPAMRGGWQMVALSRKIEDRTTDDGKLEPHVVLTLFTNGRVSEAVKLYKKKTLPPVLYLGSISSGSSSKFRGAIDHMSIYDRALSEDEMRELMGFMRQSKGRSDPDLTVARNEISGNTDAEINDELTYEQVGREQQFPGDAFEGGEQQFPGDAFEDGERPTSIAQDTESSGSVALPGSSSPDSRDAMDAFARDPQQQLNRQLDEAARQQAVEDVAVANSPLRDALPPAVVDTTAMNDDADFEAPALVTDQRAEAEPHASTDAIGASNPTFTPPVSTADETEELIASEEGQEMLQSADWRIEGMVPNSADRTDLYPGDEVTLKIRISKDDPANKIPDVKLVTNVGPGTPSPSYDLTINTADGKPTDERDIPITLPVPTNLPFEEGDTQMVWRPRVWLNTHAGMPLRDAIADNHSRELALVVKNSVANNDCTDVIEREDGTRVTRPCLVQEGSMVQADSVSEIYIDHSVLVSTDLEFAGDHEDDARELLLFGNTQRALSKIAIGEVGNKPCSIWIGDADGGADSSHHCKTGILSFSEKAYGDSVRQDEDLIRVITGLMVCRNRADNRLKGFQIETRRIWQDGSLDTSTRLEPKVMEPNCSKWTKLSSCAAGTAAAGLQVMWNHGTDIADQDFIHSIDLMCGKILFQAPNT